MDQQNEDQMVNVLHVSENIQRIFIVNNSQNVVNLVAHYGQRWEDSINIPVGNSSLCACRKSFMGIARSDGTYRGTSLHAKTSNIQINITWGEGWEDLALHVTICDVQSPPPTLLQLAKQFVRENGSWDSTKTRYHSLLKEIPTQLEQEVCESYTELRTEYQLEGYSKREAIFYCKCTLFWYGPGQQYARYGPNLPIKYIKRFHRRGFTRRLAILRAQARAVAYQTVHRI
jgi:hypothetical protein